MLDNVENYYEESAKTGLKEQLNNTKNFNYLEEKIKYINSISNEE